MPTAIGPTSAQFKDSYSLKQFKDMLICGREHVHPVNTAYFSISTLTEQAQWHGSSVDLLSPFMCNNSTIMNRTVNLIAKLFPKIARRPALADELAKKQIRVNAISPAVVRTAIFTEAQEGYLSEQENKYPLGLASAEDIAATIVFLLSDSSMAITGENIVIDSGCPNIS
jgi:enoyl-[acyl-carrier-protein] reductase (NADH)